MKERFYVIDDSGNVSYGMTSEDDSEPEHFESEAGAITRAKELAEASPGEEIYVTRAIKIVACPVGEVEIESC